MQLAGHECSRVTVIRLLGDGDAFETLFEQRAEVGQGREVQSMVLSQL